MKRRLLSGTILLGSCAVMLSGCYDRIEVNDLVFVMGTSIDQGDNGQPRVSIQMFTPKEAGGGQEGGVADGGGKSGFGGQTIVRTAEGKTVAEAILHLQEQLSRKLFWGHDEVYIFSEERAAVGIEEDLDFLLRSRQPRERADIYISRGAGADTLKLIPILERDSAETLREMSNMKMGMDVTMFDLFRMSSSMGKAAVLPYVEALPAPSGAPANRSVSYMNGGVILKKGVMVGKMSHEMSRAMLWMTNKVQQDILTFQIRDASGWVSLRVVGSHTTLVPRIRGDTWEVEVYNKMQTNLVQNATTVPLAEKEGSKKVEQDAAMEIEKHLTNVLEASQKQWGADIFNLAELFRRKYPRQVKAAASDWDAQYRQIRFHFHVHCAINRPGITNTTIPY